ncbi:ATP-dependent metallopeptidase FtsH/Yme1/Tma family protein [Tepidimicrobium xylanilyticum]|uniref:ATP-dependent zinc metalloprotease FtsH n=1 Tax=Tepidimicrobium xylanilyticum TaxID=1123352 RepID=A0A1H3A7W1_9FIRM|nr:FtsH/Yme1/Tma family ATP-dependent metallopeptidase [Tepidimicrobium xylanilyticum]GMG96292.1 cell division protein FtsH [Tepidimicrobium xylanilyticum]SDX25655.1 cell division protease FtsH [Tepidimicrobium xylanilyticum]
MKEKGRIKLLLALAISIILIASIYFYINSSSEHRKIAYNQFIDLVEVNLVEEVKLDSSDKLTGILKDGSKFITDNPRREDFKEYLLLRDVKVIEEGSGPLNQGISFLLIVTAIGGVAFLIKNSSKQAEKEMATMSNIDAETSPEDNVTFDDVAGNEEAKESLKELVDFIREPEKYLNYGARLPRGVLLYGPPGTGKTLLAKALANEAKVPFYAVSGSDFVQVYAGLGASRIRQLFKIAKEKGKSVIFIDEIDALGKKRKGVNSQSSSEEGDRTLNALLTEMSGFKGNEGIIVLAATNRIDTLDEALLRPGRFDRQIEVGLPDVNARLKILELHSRNKPLSEDVDLRKVALETVYFSGAKLENLMNESAMIAAKDRDKRITMNHINKAYFKVLVGEEKKDRASISVEDKRITAYHEAGHALVAKLISDSHRVTKVSIIPSTKGVGGFSLNIPSDKMYQTKKDIVDNIMIALGGRAAEEIIFGKDYVTTGASSDLQKATKMILAMIGSYGMDEQLGLLSYDVILNSNLNNDISLIERARDMLGNLYRETVELLNKNRVYLNMIADKLVMKESLDEEELNEILVDLP